jgi:hypothetical protein
MLHGRDFYNMMLHALERNLGAHNIDEVTSGDKLFMIDDSMFGADETDRTLRLFTKDFVEANMSISLGDTSKDVGTWEKDFHAHDVTSTYYNSKVKKVSDKDINDWLSKNAIEFI